MSVFDLATFVKGTSVSYDQRDKVAKFLGDQARIASYFLLENDPKDDTGKRLKNLQKAISTGRKGFRFPNAFKELKGFCDLLKGKETGLKYVAMICQYLGMMWHWLTDHVAFLIKAKVMDGDDKYYSGIGGFGWSLGCTLKFIFATIKLKALYAKQKGVELSKEKRHKTFNEEVTTVKTFCDMCVSLNTGGETLVGPCFWYRVLGFKLNDGIIGCLGVTAATCVLIKNWPEDKN